MRCAARFTSKHGFQQFMSALLKRRCFAAEDRSHVACHQRSRTSCDQPETWCREAHSCRPRARLRRTLPRDQPHPLSDGDRSRLHRPSEAQSAPVPDEGPLLHCIVRRPHVASHVLAGLPRLSVSFRSSVITTSRAGQPRCRALASRRDAVIASWPQPAKKPSSSTIATRPWVSLGRIRPQLRCVGCCRENTGAAAADGSAASRRSRDERRSVRICVSARAMYTVPRLSSSPL